MKKYCKPELYCINIEAEPLMAVSSLHDEVVGGDEYVKQQYDPSFDIWRSKLWD